VIDYCATVRAELEETEPGIRGKRLQRVEGHRVVAEAG
jgi:hypothetical protein